MDIKPYEYKQESANRILEEVGWKMGNDGVREKDGKKLVLEILYNSDSVTEKNIAELIQADYKKIGVQINITGQEEQSYRDNMKSGNFDIVFNINWGMPYDPQSTLSGMTAPVYGDYAAQQGLDNKAEIDDAIGKILVSTDEAKRQELYDFVLTALHEDAVYIPLTYECNKAIYTNKLKGVNFTQTQYEVPFYNMYFE
ncbi:MAG: ABC transporter substrate-binding protein [Lachnospiraceae bacterium]|nr:ABC transporter substrate-binding protein [Lachnospiraceae bacterium]